MALSLFFTNTKMALVILTLAMALTVEINYSGTYIFYHRVHIIFFFTGEIILYFLGTYVVYNLKSSIFFYFF